nr:Chain C, RNA-directed RNA polymerase NS5 [Tick-borne encephalitis virus]
LRLESSII